MKLSPQEIRLLSTINRVGYGPIQTLAEESGIKAHSVRYTLQGLIDRRAIEPYCGINVQTLGFKNYTTYFSFKGESVEHEDQIIQVAARHQNVSWVAELSGDYQYGVQVLAPSLTEALRIFGDIRNEMKVPWFRKAFIHGSSLYVWPLKYFSEEGQPGMAHFYRPVQELFELDALDHKILRLRSDDPLSSDSRVARACGVPDTTVTYRLKRLLNAGVITSYGFRALWDTLGISQFKVAVTLKVVDLKLHEALLAFARRTVTCSVAIPCLGAWDFEFNIFALNADEGRSFTTQLWRQFGEDIDSVQLFSYPRTIKQTAYPFTDEDTVVLTPDQRKSFAVGE